LNFWQNETRAANAEYNLEEVKEALAEVNNSFYHEC